MSTRVLLDTLTRLTHELDELITERPDLADLVAIEVEGYEDPPVGLQVSAALSPADLVAWCEALGVVSGRRLAHGVPVVTATGVVGDLPVRLLSPLPRELAGELPQEWTVQQLRALIAALIVPDAGGAR